MYRFQCSAGDFFLLNFKCISKRINSILFNNNLTSLKQQQKQQQSYQHEQQYSHSKSNSQIDTDHWTMFSMHIGIFENQSNKKQPKPIRSSLESWVFCCCFALIRWFNGWAHFSSRYSQMHAVSTKRSNGRNEKKRRRRIRSNNSQPANNFISTDISQAHNIQTNSNT